MKTQMNVLSSNVLGAAAGGLATFLAAKKFGQSMLVSVLAGVAGAVVGANIQAAMKGPTIKTS